MLGIVWEVRLEGEKARKWRIGSSSGLGVDISCDLQGCIDMVTLSAGLGAEDIIGFEVWWKGSFGTKEIDVCERGGRSR
jgi:hypothetical protein